jgi:hypothetical protein
MEIASIAVKADFVEKDKNLFKVLFMRLNSIR